MTAVHVSYNLREYPGLDDKIFQAVGRHSDASGIGFGQRDHSWYCDDDDEAARIMTALEGLHLAPWLGDDGGGEEDDGGEGDHDGELFEALLAMSAQDRHALFAELLRDWRDELSPAARESLAALRTLRAFARVNAQREAVVAAYRAALTANDLHIGSIDTPEEENCRNDMLAAMERWQTAEEEELGSARDTLARFREEVWRAPEFMARGLPRDLRDAIPEAWPCVAQPRHGAAAARELGTAEKTAVAQEKGSAPTARKSGRSYACPNCGEGDHLFVMVEPATALSADGAVGTLSGGDDFEWSNESRCWCESCKYFGYVSRFIKGEQDGAQ